MGWGRWLFLVPVGYVLGHWSPQLVFEQWVSPLWFRVWVKSCPVLAPCKEWQRLEARSHCYPLHHPRGRRNLLEPPSIPLNSPPPACHILFLSPPVPASSTGTGDREPLRGSVTMQPCPPLGLLTTAAWPGWCLAKRGTAGQFLSEVRPWKCQPGKGVRAELCQCWSLGIVLSYPARIPRSLCPGTGLLWAAHFVVYFLGVHCRGPQCPSPGSCHCFSIWWERG